MANSDQDKTTKEPPFFKLPPDCDFVGRDWEIKKLVEFLADEPVKSIMLVHGPRGVGKSTLVREIAKRAIEQKIFKDVAWLDRSWASELLSLDAKRTPSLPDIDQGGAPDINALMRSDSQSFVARSLLMSKRDNNQDFHEEALAACLCEFLKNEPYLLVIDDFDEYDGLVDERALCDYLATIRCPNKVILTARLPDYAFMYPVLERTEIGLLDEEEVKKLVTKCGFANLDPVQLIERDLDATASYVWKVSGGLPEFITRFLLPIAAQRRWQLNRKWEEAFAHFSAGYLSQRLQEALFTEYEDKDKFSDNAGECAQKLEKLLDEQRYILVTLACQEEANALSDEDLARTLGYCPDDTDEFSQLHELLIDLEKDRLIARRHQGREKKHIQTEMVWTWALLPFARKFIKSQLLNSNEAKTSFYRAQADHWIHFIEKYAESPQHIERQLDRIYASFAWCVTNQERARALCLGKTLSTSLWKANFHTKGSKQRKRLIDICQRTANVAQEPEDGDWQVMVGQWFLLAQLYLDTNSTSESQSLALEYAKKAIHRLEEAHEEKVSTDELKWADIASLVVHLSFLNGDINQAQHWLEKMEKRDRKGPGWQLGASLLGRLHPDIDQAEYWLTKTALVARTRRNFPLAVQAHVDLACLFLVKKDLEQASLFIQQAREMVNQSTTPSREIGESMIRAITLEAQIAYNSDEKQKSKNLFKEAIDLAKSAHLSTIVEELQKYWYALAFRDDEFDAARRVDEILGVRPPWRKFEETQYSEFDPARKINEILGIKFQWEEIREQTCPVCRRSFVFEDLIENKLWHCPNCKIHLHTQCLMNATNCPVCRTPIAEAVQRGG